MQSSNQQEIDALKERIAKINSVSPTFCLAKWKQSTTTLYNGFTHSCHHPAAHKIKVEDILKNPKGLHNTPTKIAARQDMLNGVQTKECDYCWNIENLGQDHFSDRHYKSANEGMGIWQTFDEVVASGTGENIDPAYLEIAFETTCNFKCSYCSPSVSSRWMEEIQQHGPYELPGNKMHDLDWLRKNGQFPIHHKEQNPYIDVFWEWWPEVYQSLQTFRITGGEPLLSDHTWKIIDYMIEHPRPELKFSINTNMGVPFKLIEKLTQKLNQLHGKVREIVIYTSTEATGAQAEYARFGMEWNGFKKRVEHFLLNTPPEVRLSFMTTVNILSASTFHEFLRYLSDLRRCYGARRYSNRIGFNIAYLRWPQHQSITLLDKKQKRKFGERMEAVIAELTEGGQSKLENLYLEEIDMVQRLVNFMNSVEPDPKQPAALTAFFKEHDRRRGTDFLATFPELGHVYQLGQEQLDAAT